MASRLDSRSLTLFVAVADTQSFRQAAETLHLSQPPLSRAIRELEERLGTRLFERSTQGVGLTPSGRTLLPYARRVIRLLAQAEAALSGTQSVPTTLRLGLTSAVEPAWFHGIGARVQKACPGTVVSTSSDSSPRLVRKLLAGKLDAAFVALPTHAPGLRVQELDRLPMVLALSSSHRLTARREVSLAQLAQEPVFWFERARQPAFYDHAQKVFARHGFAPGKLLREPTDHHVLLAAVAAGTGLALLPRSFTALKRAGVAYRRLAEGEELSVGIGLASLADRDAIHDLLAKSAGAP